MTPLEELKDSELVRRSGEGSPDAFDVLVRRHQEKIFHAVHRFCGDWHHAADITQRAFLNAFRKIREFKGDAAFSTWMYRIAFNQSISFRREQKRHRAMSLQEEESHVEPAVEDDASARMQTEEAREAVQQALDRLDDDDRRIIILKDLQNLAYGDIARILEIPTGTVRSRLHRARLALRETLKSFSGTRSGEKASN